MLHHHSQVPLHLPQCPTCGLPMAIARIHPSSDSARPADRYVYQCPNGHSEDGLADIKRPKIQGEL